MRLKMLYGLLCLALFINGKAWAEEETRDPQAKAVYQDYGNTSRDISVSMSTTGIVLISSAAVEAVSNIDSTVDLGIQEWKFREIINVSTVSALRLYPVSDYNQYSSSGGVVLSTGPFGAGDSYVVPHQGPVWGIWAPYGVACGNCAGAGGTENYWNLSQDPKKRR